jgi:TMEM175 potassium channel family protein
VLEAQSHGRPGSYERGTEEFSRVLAFSDGVFAIAMTLLVVGITVPVLHGADEDSVAALADELNDLVPNFISFFISFAVIGRYWAAHHEFVGLLARIDTRLIATNLLYLAFIAFLPFPTALLGTLFENPLSVALYAVIVAIVSGLEVVQFRQAHRRALLRQKIPDDVYRWGVIQSLSPVVFFLLSVPVAFVSTSLAVAVWFGGIPFQIVANRWKPPDADRYLAH